ncbi:TatD family deoxyribonuclease [Glutamicibacter creatinolyticus]|uniref:TatD family deoxyribonuclease n=1 Tax=Glutamicibacter creatinolyticus TaxID=162496 RepID=A0A5B7WTL4_9MICC|nr:TatD family hydrolase [Glutamicibacter creatinolyticus]QCY47309.1 TatD family deoxyribonuclease [Glutamicibacter creatinolyticus]
MSPQLPPLDLHAHINPKTSAAELERLGAVVFAATRSLSEYESVRSRRDQVTIWGVGCHPGVAAAHRDFDKEKFSSLLPSTAFVSEIGLDRRSRVSLDEQERVFTSILEAMQGTPRIASIHSAGLAECVLHALEQTPIKGAVLHWWRGTPAQTTRAVELGCWFSVNAAGARFPADVSNIPLDRILTETDHPSGDRDSPAPRQPGAVMNVEQSLAVIYGIPTTAIRTQVWANFARLAHETGTVTLLPRPVQRMVGAVG